MTKVQLVVILPVTLFAPGYKFQDSDQVKNKFNFHMLSRYVVH
jgi:hypothetical protein